MGRSGPLRDNADFRRYWLGQAASELGTQMSLVAFPLLVLTMHGSAVQAGAIGSCSLIARTGCRFIAGHLADHVNRRLIMLVSDLIRAVALASVVVAGIAGVLTFPQLLVVAIIEGIAGALFQLAALVSVRQLVPADQLTAALSRSQARAASTALLGPALGGWLFTLNRLIPFAGDALSYLVSALCVGRIRSSLDPVPRSGAVDRRLSAGLRWLARNPKLLATYAFAGLINLVTAAAILVTVLTLRQHGHTETVVGLVLAGIGAGSILGAIAASPLVDRLHPVTLLVLLGSAWAVALPVFAVSSSPWVMGILLAQLFLLSPASGVLVGRTLLTAVPVGIQARVGAAGDIVMSSLWAIGPIVAGLALRDLGPGRTWLLLSGIAAAAAVVAALPTLLRRDPEQGGATPAPLATTVGTA